MKREELSELLAFVKRAKLEQESLREILRQLFYYV